MTQSDSRGEKDIMLLVRVAVFIGLIVLFIAIVWGIETLASRSERKEAAPGAKQEAAGNDLLQQNR